MLIHYNSHCRRVVVGRYQESGIIHKWYLEFSREQKGYGTLFEDYPEKDFHHQINLVNLSGAFFLLCTGLAISAVSFFVEYIKYRRLKYYTKAVY